MTRWVRQIACQSLAFSLSLPLQAADIDRVMTVERGESYAIEYAASADGPVLVTVDQLGIDITVELRAGEDRVSETDSHTGDYGREYNVIDALAGEMVVITINPPSNPGPAGRVVLKVEQLSPVSDSRRLAAARAATRGG